MQFLPVKVFSTDLWSWTITLFLNLHIHKFANYNTGPGNYPHSSPMWTRPYRVCVLSLLRCCITDIHSLYFSVTPPPICYTPPCPWILICIRKYKIQYNNLILSTVSCVFIWLCSDVSAYWHYTLSHLENDRDVSAHYRGSACHRTRNLCVFSRVQKGTPGLTHKGCVL